MSGATELRAAIEGSKGDWSAASDRVQPMIESAQREKDARYLANGLRELAHYELHLGASEKSAGTIAALGQLLSSGLQAQEAEITLHHLILGAAQELVRGSEEEARRLADHAASRISASGMSFPFSYWADFLLFRTLVDLEFAPTRAANGRSVAGQIALVERGLRRKASVHPIAVPTASIAAGCLRRIENAPAAARKNWETALRSAEKLQMSMETSLARNLLGAGALPFPGSLHPIMLRGHWPLR